MDSTAKTTAQADQRLMMMMAMMMMMMTLMVMKEKHLLMVKLGITLR
jgi:hypothetical protein